MPLFALPLRNWYVIIIPHFSFFHHRIIINLIITSSFVFPPHQHG